MILYRKKRIGSLLGKKRLFEHASRQSHNTLLNVNMYVFFLVYNSIYDLPSDTNLTHLFRNLIFDNCKVLHTNKLNLIENLMNPPHQGLFNDHT